jgi:hypothetical protein
VYVSDRDNNRIQKFTNDGNFITKLDDVTSLGIALVQMGICMYHHSLIKSKNLHLMVNLLKNGVHLGTDDGELTLLLVSPLIPIMKLML